MYRPLKDATSLLTLRCQQAQIRQGFAALSRAASPLYDPAVEMSPLSGLGEDDMPNLSAPTAPVFLISVVLALFALIGHFVTIPFVTMYQFWVAIAAYVVLFLGTVLKDF